MVGSIVIITISLLLFAYWFRYTCLLVLSTKTSKDYSQDVAAANQLRFVEVQKRLKNVRMPVQLDLLEVALERDYQLLRCLLNSAAGGGASGLALEDRMLAVDYWLMRSWYSMARLMGLPQAREALVEMSEIVRHFANNVGERLAGVPVRSI